MPTDTLTFVDDGDVPNHPHWPMIVYAQAIAPETVQRSEYAFDELFERNGWPVGFRNGIYPFTHYHSNAHEVLGIARGEIRRQESSEARIVADLGSKMAVIAYARKCWSVANEAVMKVGDAQLNASIDTPWSMEIAGWTGFNILNDEFLHHYGQLYTYARLCGAEPPFLWGFAESALQYRFAD